MEINKLLTMTTSGRKMPMFDLGGKDDTISPKEDLIFTNLNDLFIAVAPSDLVALDKLGNLHKVKAGEYIIKSNCREIYFILSANDTLATLVSKANEAEEAKNKEKAESAVISSTSTVDFRDCEGCCDPVPNCEECCDESPVCANDRVGTILNN